MKKAIIVIIASCSMGCYMLYKQDQTITAQADTIATQADTITEKSLKIQELEKQVTLLKSQKMHLEETTVEFRNPLKEWGKLFTKPQQ